MNPLNTFPALLDYIIFAPIILRLAVGFFIISLGKDRLKKDLSFLSIFYFIFGAALILGFYTQISSIASILLLKTDFYLEYWRNRKINPVPKNYRMLYTMAIVILLSLLVTGAGAFALDMPF